MYRPKRKWFVLLSVVLLLGIVISFRFYRSKSFFERFKDELREKGEKPTYADLVPHPQTNVAQYERLTNAAAAFRNLKFSPGGWAYMNIVSPGRAVVAWKRELLPEEHYSQAWTNGVLMNVTNQVTNTWRDFSVEAAQLKPKMTEVSELLKTPAPDFAIDHSAFVTNYPFMAERVVAQWLCGLTLLSLHDGKLDEAATNFETLANLQRLYRNEPSLIVQMIRVAICGLMTGVTWEALQADGWSDAQLAIIQRSLESVEIPRMMVTAFIGERNLHIQLFETFQTNEIRPLIRMSPVPPSSTPSNKVGEALEKDILLPAWRAVFGKGDFLFGQRFYDHLLQRARRLEKNEPWVLVRKEPVPADCDVNIATTNFWGSLQHLISAMSIPNFEKAFSTAMRNNALRVIAFTGVAIKRYELRYGKPPPNLDALVPDFLDAVPIDCMDGKSIKYRLHSDGEPTLYSVGEDGREDGGDPTLTTPTNVVSWEMIFNGKDIVWPKPATNNAAKN